MIERLWHVQFYLEPDQIAMEEYVMASTSIEASRVVEEYYKDKTKIDVVSVSLRADRILPAKVAV